MRALAIALVLVGCGDDGGNKTGSCDSRSVNGVCSDYTAAADVLALYKAQGCMGGTWKDGPCDRTGSVGGCKGYDASLKLTTVNWEFPPQTAAGLMAQCTAPATYVTP